MKESAVLFISDLHTHYHVINEQIAHAEENSGPIGQVVVLGDFGFFGSHLHKYFRHSGYRFLRPVSFIDGNHEDHSVLAKLVGQYDDVVRYLPRGSIWPMGSMKGLCLGGARYMDSVSTPRGSEITTEDIEVCLAHDADAVDLVLTHDCPAGIGVGGTPGMEGYGPPGVPQMAQLAKHFQPRLWFFGHHHQWFDNYFEGTRYLGLPESWVGYAVMDKAGHVELIEHPVTMKAKPWWKKFLRV
jgi:predicted phosphodiesterase